MSSDRDPAIGFIDTNVFVHAHANDTFSEECRAFLLALERGTIHVRLDPLVLHELSYALPRYLKQMADRRQLAEYLLMVIDWPGIIAEKDLLRTAVENWWPRHGISFVDAYLGAIAVRNACPVDTKNVKDLSALGVEVPQPLLGE
jgi:predicted nucleic acid-binding protein